MKQREAVYNAVIEVMGEQADMLFEPTAEQRKMIVDRVAEGINEGNVDFSESAVEKYDTEAKVRLYTSGLVSNWLRKDKRLNGDTTYKPANPGSRTGQGDPQLRELRKLLKLHKGTADEAKIQSFIDSRVATIKAEKAKDIEIDVDQLPLELQDLAS